MRALPKLACFAAQSHTASWCNRTKFKAAVAAVLPSRWNSMSTIPVLPWSAYSGHALNLGHRRRRHLGTWAASRVEYPRPDRTRSDRSSDRALPDVLSPSSIPSASPCPPSLPPPSCNVYLSCAHLLGSPRLHRATAQRATQRASDSSTLFRLRARAKKLAAHDDSVQRRPRPRHVPSTTLLSLLSLPWLSSSGSNMPHAHDAHEAGCRIAKAIGASEGLSFSCRLRMATRPHDENDDAPLPPLGSRSTEPAKPVHLTVLQHVEWNLSHNQAHIGRAPPPIPPLRSWDLFRCCAFLPCCPRGATVCRIVCHA